MQPKIEKYDQKKKTSQRTRAERSRNKVNKNLHSSSMFEFPKDGVLPFCIKTEASE